ncbi:MAG TPA: TIGR02206 family membrane protein [Chthoniobacterales bacterium]|nr:TIGR02206 family membrane protein [Chthoniobacterales bacterium]
MNGPSAFHAFSVEHCVVIFLTVALPIACAALVRRTGSMTLERAIAHSLSALLIGNYAVYLLFIRRWGDLNWQQTLPMQLCDWAMVVIVVTLTSGNRRWFEVAYFWGIGGTLQAILTPNLFHGFPDLRFISFFVAHGGIIVGIVFLMLTRGYRPYPISIVRAFVWAEVYFVVALVVDQLTGVNYGFLLHKPEAFSLLSFLSDFRPLYLLQMHGLALVFFMVLYLPFALYDWTRPARDPAL